jgi:hypothetical protein
MRLLALFVTLVAVSAPSFAHAEERELQLTAEADVGRFGLGGRIGARYGYFEAQLGTSTFLVSDTVYVGAQVMPVPHQRVNPFFYGRVGSYHEDGFKNLPQVDGPFLSLGLGVDVNVGKSVYLTAQLGRAWLFGTESFNDEPHHESGFDGSLGVGVRF